MKSKHCSVWCIEMGSVCILDAECDVCGKEHPTEECPVLGLSSSHFTPQISR